MGRGLVSMDYFSLEAMKLNHPGWKLLSAAHAPLAAHFFYRAFLEPNVREIPRGELIAKLEDALFEIRETLGADAFPQPPAAYLDDWADDDHGWLHKSYPLGGDEPHYDLTPAAEKAVRWLENLGERAFVGTESRLMTVLDLLRQIVEGSTDNPEIRLQELGRRQAEIEEEMERVRNGEWTRLSGPRLKDRFQQMSDTARQLLADFREVEQNFHRLDRETRRQIVLWDRTKAELLERVFSETDSIDSSDQGQTFRAFWEFLMAPDRQAELSYLLSEVYELAAQEALHPDPRLKRIHHDWLEAGEHALKTVALLSEQLRRFLDDEVWLENRRIVDLLKNIEAKAVSLDGQFPSGTFMEIDLPSYEIDLPMEQTLYAAARRPIVDSRIEAQEAVDVDVTSLFNQVAVDKGILRERVERALIMHSEVTLAKLVLENPLDQGLAELVAYLSVASEGEAAGQSFAAVIDEDVRDVVVLGEQEGGPRHARIPRVTFRRL